MAKLAVISVDGHVRASRSAYRDYVSAPHLEDFDDWARELDGTPDAGNKSTKLPDESQWDAELRWADLEPQGVVAEVLFPNGLPFNIARFEDIGTAQRPELLAEGRRAHNRWLADFCAQAPERFAGLAVVAFDDVDACVADVEWAAEHGLRGIMMPALEPGGRFFFEPELDPIWAACAATGLVVAQHGGTGSPAYPPGIASILTLPIEQSFFSGRSLWQMIWGGVFERHPTLRYALVETMIDWVPGVLRFMDGLAAGGEGWMAFAKMIGRGTPMITKLPSEFWATNCFAGSSPPARLEFAMRDELGVDRLMFGVDYPHFETAWPAVKETVRGTLGHLGYTEQDARKVLMENPARAFGFDLDVLAGDVERVGIDAGDLLDVTMSSAEVAQVSYLREGHASTGVPLAGVKRH